MWEQEKQHKAKFEELINKYRARPSFLSPLWNVAGFALGAGKQKIILSVLGIVIKAFFFFFFKSCTDFEEHFATILSRFQKRFWEYFEKTLTT